jgi:hypothetical protein
VAGVVDRGQPDVPHAGEMVVVVARKRHVSRDRETELVGGV